MVEQGRSILSEPIGPVQLAGGLAIVAAGAILERAPLQAAARLRGRGRRPEPSPVRPGSLSGG